MNKNKIILILFMFYPFILFAQLLDDFVDGDFTSLVEWTGDVNKFKINNDLQLQLNSSGTDISFLSTSYTLSKNMEWQFWIKLSFNTSANNYAMVYLTSDQKNLCDSINGYFIRIGGSIDSIALCKQNKNQVKSLIKSKFAFTGNTTNTFRIKITKDQFNKWTLFTDITGGNYFKMEGSAVDTLSQTLSFMGVLCKYTSSNASKLYFDDFYAGSINTDTIPPKVKSIQTLSDSTIDIIFTEFTEQRTSELISNYSLNENIHPTKIQQDAQNKTIVHLQFNAHFNKNTINTLRLDSISDLSGNYLKINQLTFVLPDNAKKNDIILNEILFNPKSEGVDFVEIYNRSEKIINLNDLVLSSYDININSLINLKEITSDYILIFPQEYWVLTTDTAKVKQQYDSQNSTNFIQMNALPEFNNDAGIVAIADKKNNIIDRFDYNEKYHFPLLNTTEGVSLERINYNSASNDPSNWHSASESVGLATPCYKNSQSISITETNSEITVSPEIFSPDNDGYDDIVSIRYHLSDPGYVMNIFIFNSEGRQIKNLVKNKICGTEGNFTWDGLMDNNTKADIGIYIIYVELFNLKGKIQKIKKIVVVGGKL